MTLQHRDVDLQRSDFAAFFKTLHDDNAPFAWQERLLDRVLAAGWPETIDAPTGSGKTATIDVHVFALALAASRGDRLPPRRLALIVGRRVLVDAQYEYAHALAARLAEPEDSEVLGRVAAALWTVQGEPVPERSPLMVARLRGGQPPSRRWVDHPAAPAVVCATPDMWGSRVLLRGYGSAAQAWPREAGLLAFDAVAVVDEAHLSRQLLHTARRVAELAPVAETPWTGPPPLQVVATTATPQDSGDRFGVADTDVDTDPVLATRLRRPKPVELVARKDWNATSVAIATDIAARTAELYDRVAADTAGTAADSAVDTAAAEDRPVPPARTVGCFVNTVARAVAVTGLLRNRHGLTVVMVCGQVRPIDVELLRRQFPGVLSPSGSPDVDVIVSTQTLEVGVDLDLAGMVTELADGSALAQRAGRVNRRGQRRSGPITVIVPDSTIRRDSHSGPYREPALSAAWSWLQRRAEDPDGVSPWALRTDPPPAAHRRQRLQRPELGDVWHWARTSDDLAARPELDLWLSDDVENPDNDTSVGLIVRHDLPDDPGEAVDLITTLRPRRYEVFTVRFHTARDALRAAADRTPVRRLAAIRVRGDEITAITLYPESDGGGPEDRLRPGDLVVLDARVELFTAPNVQDDRATPQAVVPVDDPSRRHTAPDVLEAVALLDRDLEPGEVVLRRDLDDNLAHDDPDHDGPETRRLREALEIGAEDLLDADAERTIVAKELTTHTDRMSRAAGELLLEKPPRVVDLIVQRDIDDAPVRVIVVDGRRAEADEYVRQEWTRAPRPVTLAAHQAAVAERAQRLGTLLGLPAELVEALRLAGHHHDDGKADHRFQVRLGVAPDDVADMELEPLAKSRSAVGPATLQRRLDRSGLPPRWRHEQFSVVRAWQHIQALPLADLVARLIGTTHGHGRALFPHTATELLGPHAEPALTGPAADLFDEGRWDQLIEQTHHRHGVWACAYLEAVLRAADGQISGEGR
ncbi:type I-G CRISPR-associated helicase/endonuclease Cas3g [Pseudonocardia phyllosphaerae]|uniref:type I-G CRISPR-associated helicase/endonuclease Cas3g n=1 Tax=Pseudonocardia phyllosphaerae TaxID=3390502 RepID=UPI00397C85C0